MSFKNLHDALTWLDEHDKPDEFERIGINGFILKYGNDEFKFNSSKELKDWIQEQKQQREDALDEGKIKNESD